MNSSAIEAIIFDFDHTIAHLGHFVRWDDAREELLPWYRKCGLPESFLESHDGALSLYRDVAVSGLLPEPSLRVAQQEASQILKAFEMEAVPRTFLLPAAIRLVRELPKLGVRAGIVTSNSAETVSAILNRDGISEAFETIVTRDDVHRLKPSPEGILLCCKGMEVSPDRCIKVGDWISDVEAAKAAGMRGFGLRGGDSEESELLAAGAEAVFHDVSELLTLF